MQNVAWRKTNMQRNYQQMQNYEMIKGGGGGGVGNRQ